MGDQASKSEVSIKKGDSMEIMFTPAVRAPAVWQVWHLPYQYLRINAVSTILPQISY